MMRTCIGCSLTFRTRIIAPKSRRGRGGDLSSLGNPFAPVDPNIANGASPAPNDSNPFANLTNSSSQSFPPNNANGNNQNVFQQNSSFPPASQNNTNNIFGNMSGGSSGFSFGTTSGNNPFANTSQPNQASQAPTSTQSSNPFGFKASASQANQGSNIFGAIGQPPQQSQPEKSPPKNTSVFGAQGQPSTPFGRSQENSTNASHKTSPNDMAMEMSPPSKQPVNMFSNMNNSGTAQAGGQSQQPSNIFGNLNSSNPPNNLFGNVTDSAKRSRSSKNVFGNVGDSGSHEKNDPPPPRDLFGNVNNTVDNDKASSFVSSNPFTGASTTTTAGADQASSLGQSSTTPNLFPSSETSKSQNTSNIFSQPSQNIFSASTAFPASSQNQTPQMSKPNMSASTKTSEPATAPSKFSRADSIGLFPNAFTGQGAFNATASNLSNSGGAVFNKEQSGIIGGRNGFAESTSNATVQQSPLPDPFTSNASAATESEQTKLNKKFLNIFQQLDISTDWTHVLNTTTAAYQSEVQRMQGGAYNALFGTKRKEQAEQPEDNSRPQKQAASASSNLFSPAKSAPNAEQIQQTPQSANLFQPDRGSSSTAQKFNSILGNNTTHSTPVAPQSSLFPLKENAASSSTSNLFQFKATPDAANSPSGQPQPQTTTSTNLFSAQPSDSPEKSGSSLFAPSQPSTQPNLFGNVNQASSANGSQVNGSSTNPTSNLFGQAASANTPNFEPSDSGAKPTLFGNMTNSNQTNPNVGKSLFDRISRSPSKEVETNTGTSKNPFVVESDNETGDEAEAHDASQGDHTWKPETPIKFGASVNNTPSQVNGIGQSQPNGNLFGSAKAPSTNLFQSSITSATPEGSPAKTGSLFNLNFNKPTQPNPNSLFPPSVTSNNTSRATTPGTDVNGVSASDADTETNEAEVAGDAQTAEEAEKVENRTDMTAEERENEDLLFEVEKVRIMQWSETPPLGSGATEEEKKNHKPMEWKTKGTGPLRIMRNKTTDKVRMVHRVIGRATIVINSPILREVGAKKAQKGMVSFTATGLSGSTISRWMAKMASDEKANELVDVLEQNKEE